MVLPLVTATAILASTTLVQGWGWGWGTPKKNLDMEKAVLVYLFEWRWEDVAKECEDFLQQRGFGGVIVSPPNENLVVPGRPAHERYQPVSYKLNTRSGNEDDLKDMLRRCNKAGIEVIADVVLNNMAGNQEGDCVGTDGTPCDSKNFEFPGVPFTKDDFHTSQRAIDDYKDSELVRTGEVKGRRDLDQSKKNVQDAQIKYLNKLVTIGFAGFRLDAAKNMFPNELQTILNKVRDLNPEFGFQKNTRPFIFSDVVDFGGEGGEVISYKEYNHLGLVTDYRYGYKLGRRLKQNEQSLRLKDLAKFGDPSVNVDKYDLDLLPTDLSIMFVDNVDIQLSYEDMFYHHASSQMSRLHKMAVAFMLSWPWGTPMIFSTYRFAQNENGPPHDGDNKITSPSPNKENICKDRWVCEHRWRQVYNMVHFHNVVKGTEVNNWWTNKQNQIAFSRGNKGFIAFNKEYHPLEMEIQTGMPAGVYCDVISGSFVDGKCSKTKVTVGEDGKAKIIVPRESDQVDGILAIHVENCESGPGCQNKAESVIEWKDQGGPQSFGSRLTMLYLTVGSFLMALVIFFTKFLG